MTNQPELSSRPARTSIWVLIVWISYFLLAAQGFTRLVKAVGDWYWLNLAGVRPGPLYIAISGALWGLVAAVGLLWMVFQRPGYRLVGLASAGLLAVLYWADQLIFTWQPSGAANWPFAALLTALCLAYVFFALRPVAELRALLRR